VSDLAEIGHLSWFVGGLHVAQEGWFIIERQLTDLTGYCYRKQIIFTNEKHKPNNSIDLFQKSIFMVNKTNANDH